MIWNRKTFRANWSHAQQLRSGSMIPTSLFQSSQQKLRWELMIDQCNTRPHWRANKLQVSTLVLWIVKFHEIPVINGQHSRLPSVVFRFQKHPVRERVSLLASKLTSQVDGHSLSSSKSVCTKVDGNRTMHTLILALHYLSYFSFQFLLIYKRWFDKNILNERLS